MIIKPSLLRLIIIVSFVTLFPSIQKQWLNLYSFSLDSFSFYSILYYLSGAICPIIVFYNSINKFTSYSLYKNNLKVNRFIEGKSLLILIIFTIVPLSFLLVHYFFINLDLLSNLFLKRTSFFRVSNSFFVYLCLFSSILLIFKQTRLFIKKLILINFFIISFLIWHLQFDAFSYNDKLLINTYLNIENLNFINIIYLFMIEIMYYTWSLIAHNNNLSNWSFPLKLKNDVLIIYKIIVFYLFIIFYYSVLGS